MVHIRFISVHILLGALLVSIVGCGVLGGRVVQPVELPVHIELNGPYDQDIPDTFIAKLRDVSVKDDETVPYIFMGVGVHFELMGDDIRSIHFYDRAAEEFHKRKNIDGEGSAATRKIVALCEFGKMEEAMRSIRQMQRDWGSLPMKAFVDYAHGYYFLTDGDYEKALSYFHQAIDENPHYRENFALFILRRDSEYGAGKAIILAHYVARMAKKDGWIDQDKAMSAGDGKNITHGIEHLKQVLECDQEIRRMKMGGVIPEVNFRIVEADVYNFLGLAEGLMENGPSSQLYLNMSLRMSKSAGDPIGEMASLFFLNQIYLFGKNVEEGLKAAESLNALADKHRFHFYQIWAKYILSRYYADSGRTLDACDILKRTLSIMERLRPIPEMHGKSYHLFNGQVVYEFLLELLVRKGDYRDSLEVAERAKAKELVNLLAGNHIGRNQLEDDLLNEAQRIAANMLDIQKKMFRCADGSIVENLTEKMKKAERDYDDVIAGIKKVNEELHALLSVQAVDLSGIQQLLGENTTLFAYFVTDHFVYVWVMNKDRIHLERIDIEREELQRLILSLFDAMKSDNKSKTKAFATAVYDTILKPIISFVYGDRVGFIPHDVLYYLPFAALSYRGKYLVEGFSIFYLPNMSEFKNVLGKKNSGGLKILAFGNPVLGNDGFDLPYAEAELGRIKKRFADAQIFMGSDAAISKVKDMMDVYDIVHFAVRGDYDPAEPLRSALILTPVGQDAGRLTALEIFKLRFHGRAVVLSASETNPDILSTGCDIIALNKAFLYAGTSSMVSTLWHVEGRTQVAFMDHFYGHLGKKNDLADSLRNAQLDMIHRGYSPYHWAPFILMGR